MQTRLTLRTPAGRVQDVEVNAPVGTLFGDVVTGLHAAIGATVKTEAQTDPAVGFWSDSRPVRRDERLGGSGLRSGCELGVGGPAGRRTRPPAAIRLLIVSGPDAGRVEPIGRGRVRIGRDPMCEVQLTDPDVSRQHAELIVAASGITLRDLTSTNGTRTVSAHSSGTTVPAAGLDLPLDTYVTLGDTTVCVAGVSTPPVVLGTDAEGRLLVNRPPRLDERPTQRLELPAVAAPVPRGSVPWIAALVPAVGGVGLAWFLHSPQFLAFALLSPIVVLATGMSERVGGRRRRRRSRMTRFDQLAAASQATTAVIRAEITHRRWAHPDPATVLTTATTPDTRLWERRRDDDDFLDVRVGLGAHPARVRIHRGAEVLPPAMLNALPSIVSIADGPLGVCGPRPLSLPLARWVVGQLAVLHSPADLHLMALLADDAGGDWEWLRWLPHLRPGSAGAPRIARTAEHRQRLIGDLCERLDTVADQGLSSATHKPWTLILVDRCAGAPELGALHGLLARGPQSGITAVFLDDDARRLPSVCTSTARLAGETGSRVVVQARADSSSPPAPRPPAIPDGLPVADQVTAEWCERVARALAPLHDPGADDAGGLPTEVRARELFGLAELSASAIRQRWSRSSGRAFTPLAMGPSGPLEIDLARDGPHALVAGTTGAGKSELLQTLIIGLAVHAGPGDVQFVLIDYKGGAAFGSVLAFPTPPVW